MVTYDTLETRLDSFRTSSKATKYRNVVFHYDDDPRKVFFQSKNITPKDTILARINEFCDTLQGAIALANDLIARILKAYAITLPQVSPYLNDSLAQKHKELDALNQDDRIVTLLSRVIGKTLVHVADTIVMYNGMEEFQKLYESLPDIPEIGFVKPTFEEADFSMASLNMYLYVYYATIDLPTLMSAYFCTSSVVMKPFLIRRIHVCAIAILHKIYTEDKNSATVNSGYWKSIKDELAKADGYSFDVTEIEKNLNALYNKILSTFDRHVFVHYYKGHHPEVATFMQKMEDMDPRIEIAKAFMFIDTLRMMQDCLCGLLQNRADSLDKTTRENSEKLKADWSKTKAQIANLQDEQYKSAIGRLDPVKNLDKLFSALSKTKEDFVTIIVGSGQLEETLKMQASTINKPIVFTGRYEGDSIRAWYNLADVFVLASKMEAFGAVTNEALIAGCTCLVSQNAGSACLINGDNGRIIDPYDVDSMATIIDETMQAIKVRKEITLRPCKMAFTFEETIDRVINELKTL